jgi:O-antigen ligase
MYSTFPHPNALAGYAGVVLILLLVWKKMIKKVDDKTLYWLSFLTLCVVLLLTFSKLAWISLAVVGSIYLVSKMNIQLFKPFTKALFLFIISISFIFTTLSLSTVSNKQYGTVTERVALAKVAGKAFSENVLTGVGVNGYIVQLSKYDLPSDIRWLLQPVHNIYLLILSELGLILFIAVVIGLYKTLTMVLEDKSMLVFPLLFILLTGMFDHYWLTIQQNQLIATILFAVIIREYYEYKGKRVRSNKDLL